MNIDWSQLITRAMKEETAAAALLAEQKIVETQWVTAELAIIADQLLAIEDEDPTALPGTAAQWRAYRIKVRAWKDGGDPNYPQQNKRPVRPA